jgi:hypothetical protein
LASNKTWEVGTADDLLYVFNRIREEHPDAELAMWTVNDMRFNAGQCIVEGKLFQRCQLAP